MKKTRNMGVSVSRISFFIFEILLFTLSASLKANDKDVIQTEKRKGILSFDDNWPAKGEYDENDIVVRYESVIHTQVVANDTTVYIAGLEDTFTLLHAGTNAPQSFSYKIDLSPAAIERVLINGKETEILPYENGVIIHLNQSSDKTVVPHIYSSNPVIYKVRIEMNDFKVKRTDFYQIKNLYRPYTVPKTQTKEEKKDIRIYFSQLDSLLLQQYIFRDRKEERLTELKSMKNKSRTNEEKYTLNSMIYKEYKTYDSDSALYYLDENKRIAELTQNKEWVFTCKIEESFVRSAMGFLQESLEIMKEIPTSELPRPLLSEYYGQMMYLYSHLRDYSGGEPKMSKFYSQKKSDYTDSIFAVATPGEPRYLWCRTWKYTGTPEIQEVKKELLKRLEKEKPDTRNYAIDAYMAASISRSQNNEYDYMKYLIISAMADIRTVNKDIASLQELAQYLHERGDINRAYSYITYCAENARNYQNRVRSIQITNLQNSIHQAYQTQNEKQLFYLRVFSFVISILSLALVGAFLFIRNQMKRLSKSSEELKHSHRLLNENFGELSKLHNQLEEVNTKLKKLNTQLQQVNSQLQESNHIKEEYIGYIFNLCSTYINKLEEYRKLINRKIKVGQIEEVKNMTDSSSVDTSELKEFYHNFDKIFLNIYPDFIKDFNALLQQEEHIEPKDGELLNTELRIYALVRLGISDSVKIAEFLHCSPQTVYNKRLQTRNKAIIPKEEFASTVKRLGKAK